MLTKLIIENYALIDKLEIDFFTGFTVITGETGAGKSILLGALALILGQRIDPSVMLDPNRKCVVEGHFALKNYNLEDFFASNELDYEEVSILHREISHSAKSRAFINDTPVTLNILKELVEHLLNIHSQHSIITLNDSNFQLAVIDDYAGIQNEVGKFKEKFSGYLKHKKQLQELIDTESKSRNDRDYYQFLLQELEIANIKSGEQDELERKLQVLSHAEEIKTSLFKASGLLSDAESGVLRQLTEIMNLVSAVAKYQPEFADISNRIKSDHIDLKDINASFEKLAEEIMVEPDEMEFTTNRLDLIYRLEKKHHVPNEDGLIVLKDELENKLKDISTVENNITDLQILIEDELKFLFDTAQKISGNRLKVIGDLEHNITSLLKELGMPDARFRIEHLCSPDLTVDGIDKVKFLFSSNTGIELDDVSKIASGGELSRLMLSIKSLISQKNLLPTIIFDEIDNGVSGNIAGKVGGILKKMAAKMQVIAITHLPQIAGMGEHHLLVYKITDKGTTRSLIKKLERGERIDEIAKMLGKGDITVSASKLAVELLKN
jgi:DNA repair protein RecN (Recombination protein N)